MPGVCPVLAQAIIGECSVCRRRCCRGCLEDATGECWACLGYSSPQEEEAKMTPTTTPKGGRWELTVAPFDSCLANKHCPVAQPLAGQCHFERHGRATNLGLLFSGLGHEWDADFIYQYYLSMRILARQQRREGHFGAVQKLFWTKWGMQHSQCDICKEFRQMMRG